MRRQRDLKKNLLSRKPYKKEPLLRQTRELSALLTIAETATQSLDTEKILSDTLAKSLEILGFHAGYIRTLDAEARNLIVRVARGLSSPEFLTNLAPIDSPRRTVGKIVFETREPYVSLDIRKDPIFKRRAMEQEGIISLAIVPILSKRRVLGTMAVGSRKYHRFSHGAINLLKAFV